jgi:hypothetical protein
MEILNVHHDTKYIIVYLQKVFLQATEEVSLNTMFR